MLQSCKRQAGLKYKPSSKVHSQSCTSHVHLPGRSWAASLDTAILPCELLQLQSLAELQSLYRFRRQSSVQFFDSRCLKHTVSRP